MIANHLATLEELRTVYSLRDAMELWEADYIPKLNENVRARRAAARAEQERKARAAPGGFGAMA